MRFWLGIVPLLGTAGACGGEGHVRVQVEAPMEALSPFDDQLDELTLTIGEQVFQAPYQRDVTSIPLDGIRSAEEAWIALEGRRDTQRLVGFGRMAEPVRIDIGADTEIAIPFRRPYAYVATDSTLKAFHTGMEMSDGRFELPGFGGGASALVAVPGGRFLAAASGGQLTLIDTATHQPADGTAVPLPAAGDLVATPDGRFLVALHDTGTTGITVVDVQAALEGAGGDATRLVPIADAGLVTVTATEAFVVTSARRACVSESQLVSVPLDPPGDPTPPQSLGSCILDAKADTSARRIVLGSAQDRLEVRGVGDDAGNPVTFGQPVVNPAVVTIAAGRAVAFAREGRENDDALVMASMLLDGGEQQKVSVPIDDFVQLVTLPEAGEEASRTVAADFVEAIDASTLPDSGLVAALVRTEYRTPELDLLVVYFEPVESDVWDYFLFDVQTGQVLQVVRSECVDPHVPDDCSDSITTSQRFTPTRVSVLNGDR